LDEPYIKPWSQTSRDQELSVRFTVGSVKLNKREFLMGATTDKVKDTASEAIGKAKQGIGEAAAPTSCKAKADPGSQGQGPAGPRRRQGSRQARRQQGGRRGQQEPLIDAS
jgi:hypothetical protein